MQAPITFHVHTPPIMLPNYASYVQLSVCFCRVIYRWHFCYLLYCNWILFVTKDIILSFGEAWRSYLLHSDNQLSFVDVMHYEKLCWIYAAVFQQNRTGPYYMNAAADSAHMISHTMLPPQGAGAAAQIAQPLLGLRLPTTPLPYTPSSSSDMQPQRANAGTHGVSSVHQFPDEMYIRYSGDPNTCPLTFTENVPLFGKCTTSS